MVRKFLFCSLILLYSDSNIDTEKSNIALDTKTKSTTPASKIQTKKKVLIVTYSMNNNPMSTVLQNALQEINVQADIEKVTALSFGSWIQRATITAYSVFNKHVDIESSKLNPSDYDLIIFAFPVWSNNVALPIISYMEQNLEQVRKTKKICFLVKCREISIETHSAFGAFNRQYGTEFVLQPLIITTEEVNNNQSEDKIKDMANNIKLYLTNNLTDFLED